jgi:hypothetical protein
VQLGEPRLARPPGEELDDRDIVDRRLGVGQRHHRRDAARRRGMAGALDRFQMLGAGLAQLHPHIDEPRRQAQPAGLDNLDIVAKAGIGEARTDRGDMRTVDQQIARRIEPAFRIDQPDIAEQAARGGHCNGGRLLMSRARISRQAMRTATPIST